jgi:hypothetical protein
MTREVQRLYWVWGAMVQRCHNPKNRHYRNYGARGITVSPEWRTFATFHADMGLPPAGLTLERKDSTLGYFKENCCWADRYAQARNRPRWCRYYTVDGERLVMKDVWRRHCCPGVSYRTFVKRLVTRGWDLQRALTQSSRGSAA